MTATTTLAHPSGLSIPSSVRTSGHATPNSGSRSNTPLRMKRVLHVQLDVVSAPMQLDPDAAEEGRHVRRSSSAQALDSPCTTHASYGRRRRLSVATFGDAEGPLCPDAAATMIGDILARRQLADAAAPPTPLLYASASSSVLALQMRLGDYAVLGPDACVALALSHVADPAVQCVVVAVPGATHVLNREEVERLARYCRDPFIDTLGSFLIGSAPAPSLYPTANMAAAAALLLERPDAHFVAVVDDEVAQGEDAGGGGDFLGLLSRSDLARALLRDRGCVYEPSSTHAAGCSQRDAAAAADAAAGADAAGAAPAPEGATAATVVASRASRVVCVDSTTFRNRQGAHLQGGQTVAPLPRPPMPPPRQLSQLLQQQQQHRPVNSARGLATGTAVAAASVMAACATVAAGPVNEVAAVAARRASSAGSGGGAAGMQGSPDADGTAAVASGHLEQQPAHQSMLATCRLSPNDGESQGQQLLPLLAQPQELLLLMPQLQEPQMEEQVLLGSTSNVNANVDMAHPPVAAEGLRSFSDPIRSGWDMLDNVDDALDVLGMVGKTVNAEAVGRKLLSDMMGAAANVAGGSSGTGWIVKYLYDGDCSICRTFQAVLEKVDNGVGRVLFVDVSAQGFNPIEHGGINYRAAMETIHILSSNGQIFKGITGLIKLLVALDPDIAANLGVVTTALPLLSLGYMLLSKNRHALSQLWERLLRLSRAGQVLLLGHDVMAPGRGAGGTGAAGREPGLGSRPPAGLAGSGLGAFWRPHGGEVGGGGTGRSSLRSHQLLQTQTSC